MQYRHSGNTETLCFVPLEWILAQRITIAFVGPREKNVKFPNWFKITWWIGLFTVFTYFFVTRYNSFIDGSSTTTDVVILLVWICLLLMPLFQEISLFGMKLKQEIDSVKSEIKEQIVNLRSEIHNSIDVRTNISQQLSLSPPPPDRQLPVLEERFRKVLKEELRKYGIPGQVETPSKIDVPDNASFLFSVRFSIERELRRIWQERFGKIKNTRPYSPYQITRSLLEHELIDPQLVDIIREVNSICSLAIHGEKVSQDQVDFVRRIVADLVASLEAIH